MNSEIKNISDLQAGDTILDKGIAVAKVVNVNRGFLRTIKDTGPRVGSKLVDFRNLQTGKLEWFCGLNDATVTVKKG